jgi:hypothetical protein
MGVGGLHEEHTAATGNNLFLRLKTEENQENLCWPFAGLSGCIQTSSQREYRGILRFPLQLLCRFAVITVH